MKCNQMKRSEMKYNMWITINIKFYYLDILRSNIIKNIISSKLDRTKMKVNNKIG